MLFVYIPLSYFSPLKSPVHQPVPGPNFLSQCHSHVNQSQVKVMYSPLKVKIPVSVWSSVIDNGSFVDIVKSFVLLDTGKSIDIEV